MNVGLLTYHAAYNYGSVLQAYATQSAVQRIGYPIRIINYRMKEQKRFYGQLYRTCYGWRTLVRDLMLLPVQKKRQVRQERFEQFFHKYLLLTPEANEPEEVKEQWQDFDTLISGSDQIWNKHSFGKNFYTFCGRHSSEFRKTDVLERLGLSGRIVRDSKVLSGLTWNPIDWGSIHAKLDTMRTQSESYLQSSLKKIFNKENCKSGVLYDYQNGK